MNSLTLAQCFLFALLLQQQEIIQAQSQLVSFKMNTFNYNLFNATSLFLFLFFHYHHNHHLYRHPSVLHNCLLFAVHMEL